MLDAEGIQKMHGSRLSSLKVEKVAYADRTILNKMRTGWCCWMGRRVERNSMRRTRSMMTALSNQQLVKRRVSHMGYSYGRSFRLTVASASVLIEVLDLCWDPVAEPIGRYKDKAAYSKVSARF
jgi:hypothetical protein